MLRHLLFLFFSLLPWILPLCGTSVAAKTSYPEFCHLAVEDDSVFANFKRHPAYCVVLEHVSYELGQRYLDIIRHDYPELLIYIDHFRQNDALGNPNTFEYEGIGHFSPTTLRYIKVAGDLRRQFGDLSQLHILEIGGGYGGQCKILADCGGFASYTIIDLPSASALAEKFLQRQNVAHVTCLDNEHLPEGQQYDLVISNFAFSEIDRSEQYQYLERVIKFIPNGYMTYNFISSVFNISSINLNELHSFLTQQHRRVTIQKERPLSGPLSNCLLVWKPADFSIQKPLKLYSTKPESLD